MSDLNSLFGECKSEFHKARTTLIFIIPRLTGSNVDKGCFIETSRLIEALNSGVEKLERLEKIVLQTFGNVPLKDLVVTENI